MNAKGSNYGVELILDLHGCDKLSFNRESLDAYFEKLCKAIDMVKCERYFWDDVGVPLEEQQTEPHKKGTSAVQFILTSSIVIHTLELMDAAYINIFSCKEFDPEVAKQLTIDWFSAKECKSHFIERT
jgi:S-adenosylmethionine decarboxylase